MKKSGSPAASAAKAEGKDDSGKATAKVKEVNLEHMPQFIKNAPWYLN